MARPHVGLASHGRTRELEEATSLLRQLSFCSDGYVRSEYVARNELILEQVLAEPNARVVDVGCGYGALATTIANVTGARVRALDVIRQRVTTVRDRPEARGRVDLLVADAERGLPLKSGIADVVVATEVLEHLHHPERLLSEARRVLRPGGRVILTTPNSKALPYFFLGLLPRSLRSRLLRRWVQEGLHPELLGTSSDHPDAHKREGFSEGDIRGLAEGEGFAVESCFTYRIPAPDRLLALLPEGFADRLARSAARPLPGGLEVFAVLRRG